MDSPLFIIFTSGSTGDPKGVILTQGAVHWNALNSRAMHDMRRSDHIATTLPFFHVGGINVQTLPALQVGATVSVFSRFDPEEFLDFVHEERPTLTVLVPAQMQALMKLPGWDLTDMTSLRAVTTGSTIVDKDLIRTWANKGVPVIQIYGCTESCPIAVHQTVEGIGPGLGTVGHAALYTELRVADDSGMRVEQGCEGEILLRGPNIMGQYWRDEAATRAAFRDGWLLTGDLGYQDQDGRLHIVGRKKRLIISGGENIHPVEIEQVLERHPGVQEAAVIGIPNPEWGEIPVAVVSIGKGSEVNEVSIRRHLDQHLGRYKHPRHIVIAESLPHTGLEKIAYPEVGVMVEEYLAGLTSPGT
jgi:fatty-acyl-CoA synthase